LTLEPDLDNANVGRIYNRIIKHVPKGACFFIGMTGMPSVCGESPRGA